MFRFSNSAHALQGLACSADYLPPPTTRVNDSLSLGHASSASGGCAWASSSMGLEDGVD